MFHKVPKGSRVIGRKYGRLIWDTPDGYKLMVASGNDKVPESISRYKNFLGSDMSLQDDFPLEQAQTLIELGASSEEYKKQLDKIFVPPATNQNLVAQTQTANQSKGSKAHNAEVYGEQDYNTFYDSYSRRKQGNNDLNIDNLFADGTGELANERLIQLNKEAEKHVNPNKINILNTNELNPPEYGDFFTEEFAMGKTPLVTKDYLKSDNPKFPDSFMDNRNKVLGISTVEHPLNSELEHRKNSLKESKRKLSENWRDWLTDRYGFEIPDNIDIYKNIEEAREFKRRWRSGDLTAFWDFIQAVNDDSKWDYKMLDKEAINKGQKSKYEDFGNYHFAIVARETGFFEEITKRGAGAYQLWTDIKRFYNSILDTYNENEDQKGLDQIKSILKEIEEFERIGSSYPWAGYPYGDDSSDQARIGDGIYDYDSYFK